jgi:hypothetical protein
MDRDERAALMADILRCTELLSGTLDPSEIAGLEYIIGRLNAKLAAMGPASPADTSCAPANSHLTGH